MAALPQNYTHNKEVYNRLSLGDRVKFKRNLIYSHWGIYIGLGRIVHLSGDREAGSKRNANSSHVFSIGGKLFDKASIMIDDFWIVAGEDVADIDNSLDNNYKVLEPREIVRNAMAKVGEVGYNLIYSNCEHFATWCRYGEKKSKQVQDATIGVSVSSGILLTAAVIGGIVALFKVFSKKEEEEEEEETN